MLSCRYFNAQSVVNKTGDLHDILYNIAPDSVFICEEMNTLLSLLPSPKYSGCRMQLSPLIFVHITKLQTKVNISEQKGQQNFLVDVPDLKLFLAILLISGYVSRPRRPLYWE